MYATHIFIVVKVGKERFRYRDDSGAEALMAVRGPDVLLMCPRCRRQHHRSGPEVRQLCKHCMSFSQGSSFANWKDNQREDETQLKVEGTILAR